MDWLYEGNWLVYFILIVAAAASVYGWTKQRNGWLIVLSIFFVGLVGLYSWLDYRVETRLEQIKRKFQEMAKAVEQRDAARILSHVSTNLRWGSSDYPQFRELVEDTLRRQRIDSVILWDIKFDHHNSELVVLKAKPTGGIASGAEYFFVKTRWIREGDGQYRLANITVHNPYIDADQPLEIRQFR